MSYDASVMIAWGDGEYRFRLAIGQLRELQEKTDAGPAEILRRLTIGTWRVDEVRETIRLGLIGGGMKPTDAYRLVTHYVDERPLMESILPAQVTLHAAISGVPDEPLGKEPPAEAEMEATEKDASPSPASTDQVH